MIETKSETALIKGDVLASGLQCKYMFFFSIASYSDFKCWKFEATFKGDSVHYMKIWNLVLCKNQVKLRSRKGLLKLKNVLQIFTVPNIDFISSLDINTFNSFSLNPIILRQLIKQYDTYPMALIITGAT